MDCVLITLLGNMMTDLMIIKRVFAAAVFSTAFATLSAQASGDAQHGADVFSEECGECHSIHEGTNKKGPSLFAVTGRKAASISDFEYSDSMKKSGIMWTAARLDTYINTPKKIVPGGKMKYDGLSESESRADIIAYLGTLK